MNGDGEGPDYTTMPETTDPLPDDVEPGARYLYEHYGFTVHHKGKRYVHPFKLTDES